MVSRGQYRFSDVESDSLLLVEGQDDARFFDAFLRWLNVSNIQIASVNGKGNFASFLKNVLTTAPNYSRLQRLALVSDGDSNPTGSFRSLRSALVNAGLPAPFEPFKTWTAGQISASVAVLPDGLSTGNLEDLCLRSLESGSESQSAMSCVDQYLNCRGESPDLDSGAYSKARLYAYLAVGSRPGLRLGEAADAGVWDWDSIALRPMADFLRRL